MKDFFGKIEAGNNHTRWWETLYNIYNGTEANHWYLMSKIMPRFDQILSDEILAKELLNVKFIDEMAYRHFAESLAAYASKQR